MDRNLLCYIIGVKGKRVVPYVGTWIEICRFSRCCFLPSVVPYVGTWIEILIALLDSMRVVMVVPYVGTWIEISVSTDATNSYPVVPYVGTWIEI